MMLNNLLQNGVSRGGYQPSPTLPPPFTVVLVVDGRTPPPSRSFHPRATPPSAEEPILGHRVPTWPVRCDYAEQLINFHGDPPCIRLLQESPQLRTPPQSRLARGDHCVFGYPNHLFQTPRPPPRSWDRVAEWSTFRTRSLHTVKQEVVVGHDLASSETSQVNLRSLLHPHRCGAPNSSDFRPLTIIRSCLGDLQHRSLLPVISWLLLSTKADNFPLPGHLRNSLCCHSRRVSPLSYSKPMRPRQPFGRNRIHTRRLLALFGFTSHPRASNRQPHPRDRVEDFQRSPDYPTWSMPLGYRRRLVRCRTCL